MEFVATHLILREKCMLNVVCQKYYHDTTNELLKYRTFFMSNACVMLKNIIYSSSPEEWVNYCIASLVGFHAFPWRANFSGVDFRFEGGIPGWSKYRNSRWEGVQRQIGKTLSPRKSNAQIRFDHYIPVNYFSCSCCNNKLEIVVYYAIGDKMKSSTPYMDFSCEECFHSEMYNTMNNIYYNPMFEYYHFPITTTYAVFSRKKSVKWSRVDMYSYVSPNIDDKLE